MSCVSKFAIARLMIVSGLNTSGRSGVSNLQQCSTAVLSNDIRDVPETVSHKMR